MLVWVRNSERTQQSAVVYVALAEAGRAKGYTFTHESGTLAHSLPPYTVRLPLRPLHMA